MNTLQKALLRAVRYVDYAAGGDPDRDNPAEVVDAGLGALLSSGLTVDDLADDTQFDRSSLADLSSGTVRQLTARAPAFLNEDGTVALGKLTADAVEATRAIHPFEGRRFLGLATVTVEYDEAVNVSGMVYRADEKIAGRLPCRPVEED